MNNITLNTKIGDVENKKTGVSSLVKKTVFNAKLSDIEKKCFTNSKYNKFTWEILHAKRKRKRISYEMKYIQSHEILI